MKNAERLIDIMDNISDEFPAAIRNYNYYSDVITYKETFLPELTESDFKKT